MCLPLRKRLSTPYALAYTRQDSTIYNRDVFAFLLYSMKHSSIRKLKHATEIDRIAKTPREWQSFCYLEYFQKECFIQLGEPNDETGRNLVRRPVGIRFKTEGARNLAAYARELFISSNRGLFTKRWYLPTWKECIKPACSSCFKWDDPVW